MTENTTSKVSRKIEVWKLISKSLPMDHILSELEYAGIFKQNEADFTGKSLEDKIIELMKLIEKAIKSDKIILIDYEWVLLPDFKAKVTIITTTQIKEFEAI